MNSIQIPCTTGRVSDGYHTFDELYAHRNYLFLALMKCAGPLSWMSKFHGDGTMFDGWFVAGIDLPTGQITYHLPLYLWDTACATGAWVMERARPYDGHTSNDVLQRLKSCIETYTI